MKFLKKLSITFACALCAVGVCLSFAACGGGETSDDPDANLAEGTYVFYVYLDDGTTPVEGAKLEICYNNSTTSSTCYMTNPVTDENGRAEIDLSSVMQYSEYNENGFCVHFIESMGALVGFPDGYTYPDGAQSITLIGSIPYEHAWYITEQVTTFKLVKE